ncbi:hypothetical protein BMS83_08895 [Leuconostoc pseudomesenteroides]|nr:hypothetical protein BMS83_08895 [Leuconostoc pseudomesenteroides]
MKLNYDNQENSKRFKMYKAGKLWLVSGASIISLFGGSILMNHSVASADDTNVSTDNKIVDSSSAKNTTKEESSNDIVATSAAEESENNQTNESGKKTDDVADNLTKTTDNKHTTATTDNGEDQSSKTSSQPETNYGDEKLTKSSNEHSQDQKNSSRVEKINAGDALNKNTDLASEKNNTTDQSIPNNMSNGQSEFTDQEKKSIAVISEADVAGCPKRIQDENGNSYRVFNDLVSYNGFILQPTPTKNTANLFVGINDNATKIIFEQIDTSKRIANLYVVDNIKTADTSLNFGSQSIFSYAINSNGVLEFTLYMYTSDRPTTPQPLHGNLVIPKKVKQEVHFSVDTGKRDANGNIIYQELVNPVISEGMTTVDKYQVSSKINGNEISFPGYYFVKTIGHEAGTLSSQILDYTKNEMDAGFTDFLNHNISSSHIYKDAHGAYTYAGFQVMQDQYGNVKTYIANINNPTPSLQEAIEQFNNGQFHWLKTTDEGECKFNSNDIPYVDQSYGKINHYFGYSSDPNDPGLAWAKQHGGNFYINVKDSILPSTLVRYVYAPYERPETPGLSSWTIVNKPENPGNPGMIIDPKIPNDPKQPSGTDKASLEKVITKTIHYVDEQGKQLLADKAYQVTYTRTATYHVNNAGEVSAVEYSDWQTENDDLGNNGEPSISDYYVKVAEPDAIRDNHVKADASNIETKIVYAQVQIKTAVDVPEAHGWAVDVPEPVYVKTAVDVPEAHGWAVDVPEPVYVKTAVDVPEAHGWAVDVPEPVYVKTAVDVPEAHGWAVDVPEPVYEKTAVDVPEAHGWAVDVPEPVYEKTAVDVPEAHGWAVDVPEAHGWAVDVPEPVYVKTAVGVPEAHGWAVDVPEPVYEKTAVDVPEAHGWAVDVPEPAYVKTAVDVPEAHGWAVDVPEPVYEKTAVDVPEAHGWAVDVPELVYEKTAVDVPEAHGWAVDVPEPVYEKTAVDVPEAHGWAVDVPEPVYVKTAVDVPEPIYIKTKVDIPEPAKLTKTETKINNKKIVKNAFEKPTLQSEIEQNNFKKQLPQTSATPKKSGSSIIAVCITLVCSLLLTLKKLNHKFF